MPVTHCFGLIMPGSDDSNATLLLRDSHHGEQDKIVYTLQGYGTAVSERERSARQGHQEVNDRHNEVTWIITRTG